MVPYLGVCRMMYGVLGGKIVELNPKTERKSLSWEVSSYLHSHLPHIIFYNLFVKTSVPELVNFSPCNLIPLKFY